MKVQLVMLNPFAENALFGVAMVLTAIAVVSKLAAGVIVYQPGVRRWPVGVGMVPRGEVGVDLRRDRLSRRRNRQRLVFRPHRRGDADHILWLRPG
jgi:hypothetical protein